MSRYIDAERIPNDKFFNGMSDKEKAKVLEWFLQAPTADVQEIRHGHWIQHRYFYSPTCDNACMGDCYWTYNYSCSLCNEIEDRITNYCPNCGAKMDGEEE